MRCLHVHVPFAIEHRYYLRLPSRYPLAYTYLLLSNHLPTLSVIQNTMEILLPVILQRMKLSSETKIRKAKEENPCCCCSCCSCDCAPGEVSKYRQPEVLFTSYYYYFAQYINNAHSLSQDFLSLAELEYMKSKFDPINDVIKLYADTAIQFGYMIMFSTALPTASVCTLINNIVKLPLQVPIHSLTDLLTYVFTHLLIHACSISKYPICTKDLFLLVRKTSVSGITCSTSSCSFP